MQFVAGCVTRVLTWSQRLLLPAMIAASLGVAPALHAQDDAHVYLPAIQGPPPPVLFGTVTHEGKPIAGVTIDLWRYSNVDPVLVDTVKTDGDGQYRFLNAPRLPSDTFYSAEFPNHDPETTDDDRFAGFCWTFDLADYEGGAKHLGDMEIDNIWLGKPDHGAAVKLPATFTWTHESATPGTYAVQLFPVDGGEERYRSKPRTPNKTYTLDRLPDGFTYGKQYGWFVTYQTEQAYCGSYYSSYLTFKK